MRIKTIVPAEGWRVVTALAGFEGDVATASDAELWETQPVACFALIDYSSEGEDLADCVVPVTAVDWPSFLYPEDAKWRITILGPGETLHGPLLVDVRDEARQQILRWRAERAAA
jgi:hypothetical protein